jgi:hypothetical protein
MPKTTNEQIKDHLQNEFGGYLGEDDMDLFIDLHKPADFVGVDERSGAEYLATSHLTGYAQSWFASQLEDADYFDEVI